LYVGRAGSEQIHGLNSGQPQPAPAGVPAALNDHMLVDLKEVAHYGQRRA
jgi:hypothetical protein